MNGVAIDANCRQLHMTATASLNSTRISGAPLQHLTGTHNFKCAGWRVSRTRSSRFIHGHYWILGREQRGRIPNSRLDLISLAKPFWRPPCSPTIADRLAIAPPTAEIASLKTSHGAASWPSAFAA
jgi:hypothetical protein